MRRLKQLLIALSQLANAAFGSGWADESLSAYGHRTRGVLRAVINGLFFWQADHCRSSYESELADRQLPPAYRG